MTSKITSVIKEYVYNYHIDQLFIQLVGKKTHHLQKLVMIASNHQLKYWVVSLKDIKASMFSYILAFFYKCIRKSAFIKTLLHSFVKVNLKICLVLRDRRKL